MSESLKNDWWSSGSVDYSFSINWDGSKWITILNFTLWHDPRLNTVIHHFWSFSATCFDICEIIYCHFNTKTLLITLLWLEFRFKSFHELHEHFKGFICIRMRKLHEVNHVSVDAHDWCLTVFSFNSPKFVSKYLTTKVSRFFGWSVRALAQYIFF